MKSIKVSASVVAAAFLSGCGGGSSDMISVPAPSAFATAPTATSEALLNGQLLPTRSYSLQQDTSNSAINPSDLITNIRYNKQTQEIAIEMDGNTRTIEVSGSDSDVEIEDRYVQTGSPFTVFLVFQNDLKEFEDGNAVLRYVISYRNYGVIGAQTPASYLEQNTATAHILAVLWFKTGFRFHLEIRDINSSAIHRLMLILQRYL